MRGTPDAGAIVNRALEPHITDLFHTARRDGHRLTRETLAFDALIELARQSLHGTATATVDDRARRAPAEDARPAASANDKSAHQRDATRGTTQPPGPGDGARAPGASTTMTSGRASGRSDSPTAPGDDTRNSNDAPTANDAPASGDGASMSADTRRPLDIADSAQRPARQWRRHRGATNPDYLALLRIDLEALVRGRAQGDELCEITGVGPIPVGVARRLLGDAVLKLVITRGVDVANVTHLGRGVSAAQRVALLWQNPQCSVEGCARTLIEYDHRKDWASTHHTRLDETDPLCDHHHDLKTRHGWALIEGTGKRPMVPPDHPNHPHNRPTHHRRAQAA